MNPPSGGIVIYGGSTAQALSSTLAKMTGWIANSGFSARGTDGDVSVYPDYANNRLLLQAPGRYKIDFDVEGTTDGANDMTFQVYKNGVAVADLLTTRYFNTTNHYGASFSGELAVSASDNPKTIGTFSDTTATTSPPAQVSWAGAPKTMVPVEIYVKSASSTPNLTPVNAHFNAMRVG